MTLEFIRRKMQIHLPPAWNAVRTLPNVSGIGIGLKETGARVTGQPAWRVYVSHKSQVSALAVHHRVPDSLFGFPTDVVVQQASRLTYGNDTVDLLRPGVQISGNESGSLGCFAIRRGDPTRIVMLSNSHVIYSDAAELGVTGDVTVGQPKVSCSWCCKCKVVGNARQEDGLYAFGNEVRVDIAGQGQSRGYETDCAIADFNRRRNYTNDIEGVGMITGTPPAGNLGVLQGGDPVWMVGSTSGLVRGTILEFRYSASYLSGGSGAISPLLYPFSMTGDAASESFAGARPNINQFVIAPDPDPNNPTRKMFFSRPGDSGSVIVNAQRQVIGLIARGGDQELPGDTIAALNAVLKPNSQLGQHVGNVGIANPIHKVLQYLDIEIPNDLHGSRVDSGNEITVPSADGQSMVTLDYDTWLSKRADDFESELKALPVGKTIVDLINKHRPEVFRLVNYNRAVTVTWHRLQGPAFVALCLKNFADPQHPIPREVGGISREAIINRMADVLCEHGSAALRDAIRTAYPLVFKYLVTVSSFEEILSLAREHSTIEAPSITIA